MGLLDAVVERFKAHADGDIRPWPGEAPTKKRRRAKRVTATLSAVRELRPARTEIIMSARLTGASAAGESPAGRRR